MGGYQSSSVSEAFYRHTEACERCDDAVSAHWARHPDFILSVHAYTPTGELRKTLCPRGQVLLDAVVARQPAVA